MYVKLKDFASYTFYSLRDSEETQSRMNTKTERLGEEDNKSLLERQVVEKYLLQM